MCILYDLLVTSVKKDSVRKEIRVYSTEFKQVEKITATEPQPQRTVFKYFASHQAQNYVHVQRS